MKDVVHCEVAGERLALLPERAAYWPSRRALLVADFHLGKAASFRSAGIPMPSGTTRDNLDRLDAALARTNATSLVFLGDFLHSAQGRAASTFAQFAGWRARHAALDLTLVRGNHDRKAGDPPAEWALRCVEEGEAAAPFVFNHAPGASALGYALSGHIHPAVRLAGAGERSVRLPCFWFGARHGVLPAFGAFTGSAEVRPRAGDQVYVIAEREVVRVA